MPTPFSRAAMILEWTTLDIIETLFDTLPDPIFVKDLKHRWVVCNAAYCRLIGHPREALIGRNDLEFWPREQVEVFWRFDDAIYATGEPNEMEAFATGADGVTHTVWTRKFPIRGAEGDIIGLCGIVIDITALKDRLAKIERLEAENREQAAVIRAQADLVEQLAVPAIQVWKGVLLLPLVGEINAQRVGQVMQTLLQSVSRLRARWVIIDITGVPEVDAAVAGYLLRAAQASRLLGAQSILVGVGQGMAQTLAGLTVDLDGITIRATLEDGLRHAINALSSR